TRAARTSQPIYRRRGGPRYQRLLAVRCVARTELGALCDILGVRVLRGQRSLIIDEYDFECRSVGTTGTARRRAEGDPQDNDPVEHRRQEARRQHAVMGGRQPALQQIGAHGASRVLEIALTSIPPMSTPCFLFSSRIPVGLVTLISVT